MSTATLSGIHFIHRIGFGFSRIAYKVESLDRFPEMVDADEIEAVMEARKDVEEGKVFSEKELFNFLAV